MADTRVQKGTEHAKKLLQAPNNFTEKQLKYLGMRAEGMTLQQIADKEGITKQAVSDSISKCK